MPFLAKIKKPTRNTAGALTPDRAPFNGKRNSSAGVPLSAGPGPARPPPSALTTIPCDQGSLGRSRHVRQRGGRRLADRSLLLRRLCALRLTAASLICFPLSWGSRLVT
jgi:hypothetical protein